MEYSELEGVQRPPMTPLASKWGLYLGVLLCAVFAIQVFALNMQSRGSSMTGILNFIAMVVLLYLGMKSYRETDAEADLKYGTAVKFGIYQSLFAAFLQMAMLALTIYVLKPNFLQEVQQTVINEYQKLGLQEDMIEQSMRFAKPFYTPSFMIPSTLLSTWLTGLLGSLIAAAFVQRRKRSV